MKMYLIGLLALIIISACSHQKEPPAIYLVGDSTMADKGDPENNPEHGWGQVLPEIFNDQIVVYNHAVNGRSSRSFIGEGKWEKVMEEVNPGDYVFIQFGHNDKKEYAPSRYSNPWSAYRTNLEKMVKETKERGAHPVLLSSIVRRDFNEEGTLVDTHGPYPFVTLYVAQTADVPFIDLQQETEDLLISMGPEKSAELFLILEAGEHPMYPDGKLDNTHLNEFGARQVAAMVGDNIRRLELPLADYLVQ